jgi:paraquat-inducible protein B
MKIKSIRALATVCLFVTTAALASDNTEADKKWGAVVEKKIAAGSTVISTPDADRVKLASNIAKKYGRSTKVDKTDTGFRVTVDTTGSQVATDSKD